MVFDGVSGSAVANATAIGGMPIPWQKREGDPAGFVAANNSAAASIAILIPPSILLIIVLTLAVGLYTPPVGTTVFISSCLARVSIVHAIRELWRYYLAAITVVLLFSYVPALTLR
jgi:TRAP-type C4-dicarboxylate transport system permease large subunit